MQRVFVQKAKSNFLVGCYAMFCMVLTILALIVNMNLAEAACPGSGPVVLTGTPINAQDPNTLDPRSVSIQNDLAKVSFPQLANPDQKGAHRLDLKINGSWVQVTDPWYGDWTFFTSPFYQTAVSAHIITNTADKVEVAFKFDHWLDYAGSYSCGEKPHWWAGTQAQCDASTSCRCYLGGGGIVNYDNMGNLVVFPNTYTPRYTRHITFVKNIAMDRCRPGYYVGYHTNPQMVDSWIDNDPYTNALGEREFGLGWMGSVTFASSGTVVRNPEAGAHTSLNMIAQTTGPWWLATIPPTSSNWPYVLYIAQEHALPSFVWQFAPTHYGIPLVHKMNPQVGMDGRPERYQAFLGARPYVMVDRTMEPTTTVRNLVLNNIPSVDDWRNIE